MITGFENFIRSMFISFIINRTSNTGRIMVYRRPSVRPCTRPTISRVCNDQIKRFLHNIRTGESMTTFHFHVAELWDFVRKNMYFFHMSEEKSSKFLDFYCLQNFRSDTCTVPLMSFQSNGVPFDQFS